MKKLIICCLCAMMLLTACNTQLHEGNLHEEYLDFWAYSLGDYQVSCEEKMREFRTDIWYEYTFTFKNSDDVERQITVHTLNMTDFNAELTRAASLYLTDEANRIFGTQSFRQQEGVDIEYDRMTCNAERVEDGVDMYSASNGIRFKEVSFNTLSENHLQVELLTMMYLDNTINDYPELPQIIIDDLKFLFEGYEYSNLSVLFMVHSADPDLYNMRIRLTYDGQEYHWETTYPFSTPFGSEENAAEDQQQAPVDSAASTSVPTMK